jgi:hypothetical protein
LGGAHASGRRRVHPSTAGEYLKEAVQRRRRGRCRPGSDGPGSAGRGWRRSGAAASAWRRRSSSGGEGAGRGRRRRGGGGVHARLRCSTPGIARRGGAHAKCSKCCRLRWSSYSSRRCCILQMQQRLQTPLESVLGSNKLNHEHKVFDGLCVREGTVAAEWIK